MYNTHYRKITLKERSILAEILKGKTNKEISETFFITLHTVKAHIASLLRKTGSKHRAQLISKSFAKFLDIDLNSTDIEKIVDSILQ